MRLTIKFSNNEPIELNQLTASLNALGNQYDNFLKKSDKFDYDKKQRKLYISKLESGSIYAELMPVIAETINQANSVIEFGTYLTDCYNYFLGTIKENKYKFSKKDLTELADIINPTANDHGGQIIIDVKGDNNHIVNIINIDSTKANAIQNSLNKNSVELEEKPRYHSKVLMSWASAIFNEKHDNNSGKVIIEAIDKKPRKVVFESERDRIFATSSNSIFSNKNWQDLGYMVDVEVAYISDKPVLYKVIKLYPEDTFDPQEE